jgi:hypothetical protein
MARLISDPKPVPDQVGHLEEALGRGLDSLVAKKHLTLGDVRGLIDRLDRPDAWNRLASWDEAAQLYLAVVALRQSWVAMDPGQQAAQGQLKVRLEELRCQLEFPPGFDSPRRFNPSRLRVGR